MGRRTRCGRVRSPFGEAPGQVYIPAANPTAVPVLHPKIDASVLRLFDKVPIFSTLSERQLRRLARDFRERNYPVGAPIVHQGEIGPGFYLIVEGRVEVRRKDRRLATLGPGQFFGEMALFEDEPRSADVIAAEPTRTLVLSKFEFWAFATEQPRMLRSILQEMAHRLRETDRSLSE